MKLPFDNTCAQSSKPTLGEASKAAARDVPACAGMPGAPSARALGEALRAARACTHCADVLPLGPRPVVRASLSARLLIVGQAPGTRVHETGIPWNDPSGDRLRQWLGLDRDTFYDESRIAIVPMGLCYPGRDARGGDAPPCAGCAPLWHPRIVSLMLRLELVLLIGRYAQSYYLGDRAAPSLTETVRRWREYLPDFLPLPHPSFRNTAWLQRNPWFDVEVLPCLRERINGMFPDKPSHD